MGQCHIGNVAELECNCCRERSPEDEIPQLHKTIFIEKSAKLGKGAFGHVWRGVNLEDQSYVAIKEMSKTSHEKMREQKKLHQLICPTKERCQGSNLMYFVGAYQDTDSFYLVTEYVDGSDFDDKIKEIQQFNAAREQSYTKDIVCAIYSLHRKMIVHRDIKPANFLVSLKSSLGKSTSSKVADETRSEASKNYGSLKLCDFGHAVNCMTICDAKVIKEVVLEESRIGIAGTPNYLAPEQHEGSSYGAAVDMWAAGICLYGLLKRGVHPFAKGDGIDLEKLKEGFKSTKGTSLRKLTGTISNEEVALKNLYASLLSKNPEDRPTAEEAINGEMWMPAK